MTSPAVVKPAPRVLMPGKRFLAGEIEELVEALRQPCYGHGWKHEFSLPIRPDSAWYAVNEITESARHVKVDRIPQPSAWLDDAGVPTFLFTVGKKGVRFSVPCAGVFRWAKLNGEEITCSEGWAKHYEEPDLIDLLEDLFTWLTTAARKQYATPPVKKKKFVWGHGPRKP